MTAYYLTDLFRDSFVNPRSALLFNLDPEDSSVEYTENRMIMLDTLDNLIHSQKVLVIIMSPQVKAYEENPRFSWGHPLQLSGSPG